MIVIYISIIKRFEKILSKAFFRTFIIRIETNRTSRIYFTHSFYYFFDNLHFFDRTVFIRIIIIEFHLVIDSPEENRRMVTIFFQHTNIFVCPHINQILVWHRRLNHQPRPSSFMTYTYTVLISSSNP